MNCGCNLISPKVYEGRINFHAAKKNKLDKKIAMHSLLIKSASDQINKLQDKPIDELHKDVMDQISQLKIDQASYKVLLQKKKQKLSNVEKTLSQLRRHSKANHKLSKPRSGFHSSCKKIKQKFKDEVSQLKEKADELFHNNAPKNTSSNPPPLENLISVYNANNKVKLPGKLIYQIDPKVDEKNIVGKKAFDNALDVLNFWKSQLNLFSYDNQYAPIKAVIQYRHNYDNAYWDGEEMVYGDGDEIFGSFVDWLDITGHELGHAVIGDKLAYIGEAGALNESFADIMGAYTNMFANNIKPKDYHWLVGKDLIRIPVKIKGPNGESTIEYQKYALRSFKAPGTAYPYLAQLGGKDPQPDVYSKVDHKDSSDNYGVHENSGIPNHVCWLLTQEIDAKEVLLFWYDILVNVNKNPNITFAELANLQIETAKSQEKNDLVQALTDAWAKVEVLPDNKMQMIEASIPKEGIENIA